jgi:hypothetical protein
VPDSATRHRVPLLPQIVGYSALGGYLLWNAYWLLGVFHIPAPTTGMSRSCLALLGGNLREFFLWNPFTVPILALFVCSICVLTWRLVSARRACLPPWFLKAWIGVLLAAWVTKLALGSAWW